jgi:hypothetical protein
LSVYACCCSAPNSSPTSSAATSEMKASQANLKRLIDEEAVLDEYIAAAAAQLRELSDAEATRGSAFVFQDELRGISSLKSQTVIALKAPAGTTLEVPGVFHRSCPMPLHLRNCAFALTVIASPRKYTFQVCIGVFQILTIRSTMVTGVIKCFFRFVCRRFELCVPAPI